MGRRIPFKNWFIEDEDHPKLPTGAYALNLVVVGILIAAVLFFSFTRMNYRFNWGSVWRYRQAMANGFLVTIAISLFALLLSLFLGVVFGIGRSSKLVLFRFLSHAYIETIRGTPLIVQILVFFYVIATAFNVNNRYIAGVVIMSLFAGAYVAEVIRGGIESVSASQLESARSLGLNRRQTYRYIIFPQVITRILPALAGQFASLIKDSSLLSVISVNEFTLRAREVNANTFSTLESYIPLAIGYLALTLPVSLLTKALEKRFSYAT